ncbi:restriction endonuclease subunit S [Roseinatronobacter monicus]|uniref:Type I restriction enzyme S subunit n=1 Tax=Roseinatronobacter monicus TaxID=393481 RepID=A0A543KEW6_9RHOB|nr:restriction endonuclease subunit S [Roseinatronobacter monicus]TQM93628.1 type I restriction enzyme S subunit [Roseinatronobacter monicus]
MSGSGYLERLLDGAAVEWVPLGSDTFFEVANNARRPVKASLRETGATPYYGANNIQDYVDGFTHDGEYVLIAEDGSASLENYSVQYAVGRFWANNHVHVVRGTDAVNTCFLFHLLRTVNFQPYLTGGGRAKLTKGQLVEIPIPIPCPENPQKSLAIQAEIVRILDAFTALTAELTAELTARKTQYNHYCNQLLNFDSTEVEWKTLGEIVGTIKTGKLNANAMVENGKYPFFTCDSKPFKIDTFAFDTEAIIVSGNGSQVGHINYYNGKFNAYQRTYILADCIQEMTISFLLTYLKAFLRPYIMQHSKKGSVPYITMPMLERFAVPVPSLAEQARIVAIVDKFDTLTTSLTEGLPREIALRQKQYEYYRSLLLSFPKGDQA